MNTKQSNGLPPFPIDEMMLMHRPTLDRFISQGVSLADLPLRAPTAEVTQPEPVAMGAREVPSATAALEFLERAAVAVEVAPIARSSDLTRATQSIKQETTMNTEKTAIATLTDSDRAYCRKHGLDEETFLKSKRDLAERAEARRRDQGSAARGEAYVDPTAGVVLTNDDVAFCERYGLDPTHYLKSKREIAARKAEAAR